MIEIKLPDLGEEIEHAIVSHWYFKEGDHIKKEDDLLELTIDKATFNVPATASGILREVLIPVGQQAPIGAVLARIDY